MIGRNLASKISYGEVHLRVGDHLVKEFRWEIVSRFIVILLYKFYTITVLIEQQQVVSEKDRYPQQDGIHLTHFISRWELRYVLPLQLTFALPCENILAD